MGAPELDQSLCADESVAGDDHAAAVVDDQVVADAAGLEGKFREERANHEFRKYIDRDHCEGHSVFSLGFD